VPNPSFTGTGGQNLPLGGGVVTAPAGVPDFWRAFAVGGNIDLGIVPLAEDVLFAGSPATNAVLFRVNAFGADQGFDDDNGRFAMLPNLEYHAEFFVKSGNADNSTQAFNFGFPIFAGGNYLGREPGGLGGQTATSQWQHVVAPTFRDPQAQEGHVSWRCLDDGGENAILIAIPFIEDPGVPQLAGDCDQSGHRNITDVICVVRLLFANFDLLNRTPQVPPCSKTAGVTAVLDVNGDGAVNVSDIVSLATFLFQGGSPPAQGLACFGVPVASGCLANTGCQQ
jgi:hypothetical protein